MTMLAGDLGGTKTLIGLYDDAGARLHTQRFDSRAFGSLEAMVAVFLAEPAVRAHARPTRAVFGVAGTVTERPAGPGGQRADITNLSWDIDSAQVAEASGLRVRLVNDFYAVAAAAAAAAQDLAAGRARPDVVVLNGGQPAGRGPLAVLGAGTGLGEAVVDQSTGAPIILPSEGGHADFAPQDEVEIDLLRFLQRRHGGHVSYERVLSGAGLVALYEFFRRSGSAEDPKTDVDRALVEQPAGAAALISAHALAGDDPVCVRALHRFALIYGAEAGNLALKILARGGVFVAGGIAPKILPRLRDGTFLQGFLAKGRFSALCASFPVYILSDSEVGLSGAAAIAATL